jgi:hypothetical protein
MIHVVPVIDRGMDLSEKKISIVLVIEFDESALDAGKEGGR